VWSALAAASARNAEQCPALQQVLRTGTQRLTSPGLVQRQDDYWISLRLATTAFWHLATAASLAFTATRISLADRCRQPRRLSRLALAHRPTQARSWSIRWAASEQNPVRAHGQ